MLDDKNTRRKWLARATLGLAIGALAVVAAFASTNNPRNPAAPNTAIAGLAATNNFADASFAGPVCLGSAAGCPSTYTPGAPLEVIDPGSGQNVGPKIRMRSDNTGSPQSWWDF